MRNFFQRIAIVPFEFAIAILALGSGLTGLFYVGLPDPINHFLPAWEATTLNCVLLLCGLTLILGIISAKAATESLGLWLLNTAILAKAILYGHYFHFGKDFFLMGIFDLAIIFAGIIRLRTIRKLHILFRIKDNNAGAVVK